MKATLLIVISLITAATIFGQPCLPTVSYPITWEMVDNSGNDYHPTLMGDATIIGGYLHIGYNNDDYVEIPVEVLDGAGDFTIQFDFRLTDFNESGAFPTNTFIAGSSVSEEAEFALSYEKPLNAILVTLKNSAEEFNIMLNEETWYCLKVIRNGSAVTVYIDGVEVDTREMSDDLLDIYFLEIGQELDCPTGCFATNQCLNGDIDNFSIHPCDFGNSNCEIYIAPCDTTLLYPFDSDLNDYSGSENHGIMYGDATIDSGYLDIGYNNIDYVEIPIAALNGFNEFTISFNFKLNAFNTSGAAPTNTFIAGTSPGVDHAFALSYEKSSEALEVAINDLSGIIPVTINENEWYCVIFTWKNDTLTAKLNGELLPDFLIFPNDPLLLTFLEIGQEIDCLTGCFVENQSFNGSMDNLLITDCTEEIDCLGLPVGVVELGVEQGIRVYPNPATESITIQIPVLFKKGTLYIYDFTGKLIKTQDAFSEFHILHIPDFTPGLYLIVLEKGERRMEEKFIKIY